MTAIGKDREGGRGGRRIGPLRSFDILAPYKLGLAYYYYYYKREEQDELY